MDELKDTVGQPSPIEIVKDNSPALGNLNKAPLDITLILKKGEKISIAVYLLTEHFDKEEPLRGRMRDCVLQFIKDMNELSFRRSLQIHGALVSSLSEVLTLLEIASLSKMISEGNYSILKREVGWLSEMLATISISLEQHKTFPESLFSVAEIPEKVSGSSHKGHFNKSVLYERKASYKRDKSLVEKGTGSKRERNGERRTTILDLISKSKLASIKDIYNSFTGVSEKTIQRELTKMVQEGLLERKGDKRWSRYSLKIA